ncbi:MAG TPA: hypothetical protein VFM71_03460 [Gemmatimonadaceae bacterium]|nr:hypothetical protein [Gemmatimonadaceae bacterium]
MITWIFCIAAGLTLAALTYRVRLGGLPSRGTTVLAPLALRAVASTAIMALLLDAPLGPSRPLAPWVALDASASWLAGGDTARWHAAQRTVDSLRAAGADSVLLFGDSVRPMRTARPEDRASQVGPLVDAALAMGRPVVVVTDGVLDDPARIARLPRGSRVIAFAADTAPDAAIAGLEAPRGALGGDTIETRVVIAAGAGGAPAAQARVRLDDREVATLDVAALEPYEERELRLRVPIPALDATRRLSVAIGGEANDSASVEIVVSGAAAAVFVSTSPDQDARFALAVLRGTRRGPVQGFWRVAPGQWRTDGALRPVSEALVRRALSAAPLAVLHGDTAYFGAPRSVVARALVLIAPPAVGEDYYPTGTGDSPLGAALSGVPWDSLAPLDVGVLRPETNAAGSRFSAVVARRARRFDERTVVHLLDADRRVAVVPASGLWRWRLRGGRSADAFDAVWGSIFDWVGAEERPGLDGALVGGAGEASFQALRRETAAERAGISTELVPRRPTVASGEIGNAAPSDTAPRARGAWWLVALALVALCAEWLLRRRIGLR